MCRSSFLFALTLLCPFVASTEVAIRFHIPRISTGMCTAWEQKAILQTMTHNATVLSIEHQPWWCSYYCRGFDDATCFVAHQGCASTNFATSDTAESHGDSLGVLSEYEMLVPDINDSDLAGFDSKSRIACTKKRETALESFSLITNGQTTLLSDNCKKSVSSRRLRTACVKVPSPYEQKS